MKKRNKFLLIGLFIIIFSLNLINSIPPIYRIEADVDKGFTIVDFPHSILKQNENYTHSFFVYNKTSGDLMGNSSVSCLFYVTNSNGDLVYHENSTYVPEGYWVNVIPKETFIDLGFYYYGIKCQQGTFGGAMASVWEITSTGNERLNNSEGLLLCISIFIILSVSTFFFIFGLKINNITFAIIFFSLSGLFIFIDSLFAMSILENSLYQYINIIEGYSIYIMIIKTIVSTAVLALVVYSGLVALKLWKIKRGYVD